jgi:hypothetical protein
MMWPWISRKHLQDAENRAEKAVERADKSDAAMWRAQDALVEYKAEAEKRIESLQEENRKLIDRILLSVSQAPIFREVPAAAPPMQPIPVSSNIPAPETRHSIDDVHRTTRQAIKDGTFNTLKVVR